MWREHIEDHPRRRRYRRSALIRADLIVEPLSTGRGTGLGERVLGVVCAWITARGRPVRSCDVCHTTWFDPELSMDPLSRETSTGEG